MGEDAKLFINQGIRIMVGDKPVGFAKEGVLTCNIEDDGSTKDSGAWENPMRHSYEITGEAVVTNVGDPIRELLNDMPRKVDVVLDPFMGSGTTAIAAIRSNRHYIGFELSEEYHKTCIKRIKRETQEQTLF